MMWSEPTSRRGRNAPSAWVAPPTSGPPSERLSASFWLKRGGCSLPESTSTRAFVHSGPCAMTAHTIAHMRVGMWLSVEGDLRMPVVRLAGVEFARAWREDMATALRFEALRVLHCCSSRLWKGNWDCVGCGGGGSCRCCALSMRDARDSWEDCKVSKWHLRGTRVEFQCPEALNWGQQLTHLQPTRWEHSVSRQPPWGTRKTLHLWHEQWINSQEGRVWSCFTHKKGFVWKSTHRRAKTAWGYPYMK